MSFKTFIYYCAILGGWAGFLAWVVRTFPPFKLINIEADLLRQGAIGAVLGLLVGGLIGLLDALLNTTGFVRVIRFIICAGLGFAGGMIFGMVGEMIRRGVGMYLWGWMLVGIVIGASIGVYDLLRNAGSVKGMGLAIRKVIRGVVGGAIGGAIGGFVQDFLATSNFKDTFPESSVAIGMVILGMCIGLLIGVAQVLLKEAWVKVERGFKAGREMMLSKAETTMGRQEGVDIALFGDMGVEKRHARIVIKGDRYVLMEEQPNPPGGTFVNGERVYGPVPLKNGDLISMGRSEVRFQEKAKH
jgi:FHA domain-containing protein